MNVKSIRPFNIQSVVIDHGAGGVFLLRHLKARSSVHRCISTQSIQGSLKMSTVTVIDRFGTSHSLPIISNLSLMETIREAGMDEMLALCGGSLSCATCHVYVEPDQLDGLPPMSKDEDDLLDSSEHRLPASRLACQLSIDPSMEGLIVTIAPED